MKTIEAESRFEEIISKSRFLAVAHRVDSLDEAMQILKELTHRSASHNAWAYRIGSQMRFNDDGEVSGTAGRPILAAIERQNLDHVLVVVTRWFGGIKLGASGLTRAYGNSAATCLASAVIHEIRTFHRCLLTVPFSESSRIHTLLDQEKPIRQSERFTETGIEFTLEVPEESIAAFETAVANLTRGRAVIERIDVFLR